MRGKDSRLNGVEVGTQLQVIIYLAIGDQRRTAWFVERLIARCEVDYGKPRLHHSDVARAVSAIAIRTPVAQRVTHGAQRSRRGGRTVICHQPGNPAHQLVTWSKKFR